MQLHELKQNTKREQRRRVGRGGKRGKTSGRGHKGQKARGTPRPFIRDIIKKIPKRRGYRFKSYRENPETVSIGELGAIFSKGENVSPKSLLEKGVITLKGGKIPKVKILSGGVLDKAISVSGVSVSATARAKIEKAGGKVTNNKQPTTNNKKTKQTKSVSSL